MMAICPGCGITGFSDASDPSSACPDCVDGPPEETSGITLRDYQQECLDAHYRYFADHDGNPLMVLPTGSGKSVIQAAFLHATLDTWAEERVLCLTHVKELIRQNYERLLTLWPEAPAGIYSAGLGRRELGQSITFAGIQSIYRKAAELGHVDLVLIDEVHLVPKTGDGMYRTLLAGLREINPHLRLIGYTATPYRLDGGHLHEGADRIFTDIAYELPVRRLIDAGHLAELVARAPEHTIDTTGVRKVAGDYSKKALDAAAAKADAVHASVEEALELTRRANRKHWLIFTCGVHHADLVLAELHRHGVNARAVYGHTPKDERDETIAMAQRGDLTAIVNVSVLTTGFDWPACDALWMMRPTESTGLYVQMLGRGMRTAPGKTDCLVLDYGENVLRHGPVDDVQIKDPTAPGEGGEAPAKKCDGCGLIVPTATRVCPECGFEWPRPEPKVQRTASTASPLATPQDWLTVDRMELRRHEKFGRPDSVRVVYHCGLRTVSEWVCPEHGGYATAKFRRWWEERGGMMPTPKTADDTLLRQGELSSPERILVERDGKYERVRRSA